MSKRSSFVWLLAFCFLVVVQISWAGGPLISEQFSTNVPPSGWGHYIDPTGNGWSPTSSTYYSLAQSAYLRINNTNWFVDTWMITPQLDFTGIGSPAISLADKFEHDEKAEVAIEVVISTDYTGTGDPYAANWSRIVGVDGVVDVDLSYGWRFNKYSLVGYAGQTVYIAFHGMMAETNSAWYVDDVTIGDTADVPLPVTLSDFTGRVDVDGVVVLEWQTASELNNLGFHVYRSQAADEPFVRLTQDVIKGHGTDATAHTYQYLDRGTESGETYRYVIEDVSLDGATTRSNPVVVEFTQPLIKNGKLATRWGTLKSIR